MELALAPALAAPGSLLRTLLAACEKAVAENDGNGNLRRNGLYSSLTSEWRWARDLGLIEGTKPGQSVGRPSGEQAEIARLRRQLELANLKIAPTVAHGASLAVGDVDPA